MASSKKNLEYDVDRKSVSSQVGSGSHGDGRIQEKRLHCQICGKSFDKSCFKAHLAVHSGEKNYNCVTCGKSFTKSGSLKKHMGCCGSKT